MPTVPDTRSRLEALWLETTAEPLWMPKTLWRYIRLRRRVSLKVLARGDVDVPAPPRALPNCRACTDICCIGKKNQVSLRLVDIAMLMDMGRADLIAREHSEPPQDSSARKRLAGSQTASMFPVLKQDEDERCLALGKDKRCSIYPQWPLSCARFPYSLDRDDHEIFYSPRCPSYEIVQHHERINVMVDAALAAYNERIRDFILVEFAWPGLEQIGLAQYLRRA
jgi:Fe-S-cluster containining protein